MTEQPISPVEKPDSVTLWTTLRGRCRKRRAFNRYDAIGAVLWGIFVAVIGHQMWLPAVPFVGVLGLLAINFLVKAQCADRTNEEKSDKHGLGDGER